MSWKRMFKLTWREAGPPTHHDAQVDSDQEVVDENSLSARNLRFRMYRDYPFIKNHLASRN